MTVSTESILTSYSGDGVTTVFATGFPFFDAEDLVVVLEETATNAQTVQTLGADYTVSGGKTAVGQPATGEVTMTSAPDSGYTLHIYRASGYTQDTDLVDNTAQRAEVVESSLDALATYVQELAHRLDRAIRLPEVDDPADALAGPYPRRDTVIGFDSDGLLSLVPQADLGGEGGAGGEAVWGSITGTLSDQIDLQSALNTKASVLALNSHRDDLSNPHELSWGQILGTLSDQTDLQTALDAKIDGVAWGDITGTLSDQTDLQTALDAKLESVSIGDINASGTPVDGAVLTVAGGGLAWGEASGGSIFTTASGAGPTNAGEWVLAMDYSPDGALLACGLAASPYLRVFNTADWSEVSVVDLPSEEIGSVRFSPNGSWLAIAFLASPGLLVLDTSNWSEIAEAPSVPSACRSVSFPADSSRLAVAQVDTDTFTVFDTSNWSVVPGTPTGGGFGSAAEYSPDGSRLAVLKDSVPHLVVYDTADWSAISGTPSLPAGDHSDGLRYSPDGAYLAAADRASGSRDNLYLFSTSDWSGGSVGTVGFPSRFAFSHDSDLLAVCDEGQEGLRVYSTADGSQLPDTWERGVSRDAGGIAFSSDSAQLAIGWRADPGEDPIAIIPRSPESAVTSVNGQVGDVTLTTDNISEGSTNLYHTDARAVSAIKADPDWNATDWDTAFSWGNHATQGYLTAVAAADLTATNSPADGQVPTYDQASGGFTWGSIASGSTVGPDDLDATNLPNDNQVPTYDSATGRFTWEDAGAGGSTTFLELTDTPSSYSGADGRLAKVSGSALIFSDDVSQQTVQIDASGAPVARALEDRFTDTVHVKDFGAVGDGVVDDAPAIQSAINSGASRILLGKTHRINSTIEIRRSGVHLQGAGIHPLESSSAGDASTTLTWGGSSGGLMFYVSPDAAPNNRLITGVRVEGITFDGAGVAARGAVLESCRWCRFYLSAGNCTEYQIVTGCAYETSGANRDFQFNECAFFARATGSADGVFITGRGHETGADSGQQGNSSWNTFHYIDVRADDGIAIQLGSSDNNYFGLLRTFVYGNPSHQILFRGEKDVGGHVEGRARQEWVERCGIRSDVAAGITVEGTDTAGVTTAAGAITLNLDIENATPEPVLGTGATAYYNRGRGELVNWSHRQLAVGDTGFHAGEARDNITDEAMRVQSGSGIWARYTYFDSSLIFELRSDGANRAWIRFPTTDGTERFRFNSPVHVVSLTETSDIALKQNLGRLDPDACLAALSGLIPRTFEWKATGRSDIGLVAQEVAETLPTLVEGGEAEDDEAPKGVRYTKLVPYLIGAVQALERRIRELEGRA